MAERVVNLALQGGGAHGAFAWGVLDRLLEDGRLGFEGVVGTSAGAMNAAVLAHGLAAGGNDGARAALESFWRRISDAAAWSPIAPAPWDSEARLHGNLDQSPLYQWVITLTRLLSPYELNPLGWNPLRDIVADLVDFERLRAAPPLKLFLCASNVMTNRLRVFETHELTADAVMASACLPTLFPAVEIEGELYWDGGYMGNPPIFPVIYGCQAQDIILVMINPTNIKTAPRNAQEILDRIHTLSFNSSLMREMRAISFVTTLIDHGFTDNGRLRRLYLHLIEAEEEMAGLHVSSKLNASWPFLTRLRDLGRAHADGFLAQHWDKLGRASSVDIHERFL